MNRHTGDHKAGHHAFRRFRNTYLRNYTPCPDGLQKYWMGHAGETMTDLYDKVREDLQFRLEWVEKCGIGFELPDLGFQLSRMYQMYRKMRMWKHPFVLLNHKQLCEIDGRPWRTILENFSRFSIGHTWQGRKGTKDTNW